jgi:hypothetical protein
MSIQIPETTDTNPNGSASYKDGHTEGELAAITKLPARRAMARVSMAEEFDPLWADGFADGYLHQIEVTHALAEKGQTR